MNSISHPEKISALRLKAIIGGSIGNLVEWYDWYAYSAFALYFSSSFFSQTGCHRAAFKYGRDLCRGFFNAALWWLAIWQHCR